MVAHRLAKDVILGRFDLAIVGGGIVGLATARQVLIKHPKLKVCVVDKENELASHQSKRNSGVVHCGIYYKKGSLKSKFSIKGAKLAKDYCQTRGLPYNQCGKLIVATKKHELEALHDLFKNAEGNQIENIKLISQSRINRIQPGLDNALEAIWSPNTAIVDWQKVALSYAKDFEESGGKIIKNFIVYGFEESEGLIQMISLPGSNEVIEAKSVVSCAGVYSDFMARQTGNNEHPKVLPFKGNYFVLSDRFASTVRTNIYPVPNPKVPFLGVHITPRVDGSVLVGPTSLIALGYERYNDEPIRYYQMYHILIRSGFFKMIKHKDYFNAGLTELLRRFYKPRILEDVREFFPTLTISDLIETNFCGIRAQVVHQDGKLVDDFLFESGTLPEFHRVLHIRNSPSPAATSSLCIAERIVDILQERFI